MAYDVFSKSHTGRDWSIGAPWNTTNQDVDVKISALLTDTNNLNADISRWMASDSAKKNPRSHAFWDAWVRWRDETTKFIQSVKKGWSLKLAWNFYDNAVDRMRELEQWRFHWEELSGERSAGPASKPPAPESGGGAWKWVAIAGGGTLVSLLVAKKLGTF